MFHGHPLVYHKVVWKIYIFLRCRFRMENFWRCKWTHVSRTTWIFTGMRMAGQFQKVPNVADTTTIFCHHRWLFYANYRGEKQHPYVVRHVGFHPNETFIVFMNLSKKNLHQDQSHQKKHGLDEPSFAPYHLFCDCFHFNSLQCFPCWIFFLKKQGFWVPQFLLVWLGRWIVKQGGQNIVCFRL